MSHRPPTTLSPSRIESFLSCPLAFRFASLDGLPDPPTEATTKGSLVHRALELFMEAPRGERTPEFLDGCTETAIAEFHDGPELAWLSLDETRLAAFDNDARSLARNYLTMEDPDSIETVGLELRLEAEVGPVTLRGIIDRLERDADGRLVVSDYKTGRTPPPAYHKKSMSGVHFYALLCRERLGEAPASVRLLFVRSGEVLSAEPTEQAISFLTTRVTAVHGAIATACERDDFRPKKSALCRSCAYQRWCPEFGGDPARAAEEAPVVYAGVAPR